MWVATLLFTLLYPRGNTRFRCNFQLLFYFYFVPFQDITSFIFSFEPFARDHSRRQEYFGSVLEYYITSLFLRQYKAVCVIVVGIPGQLPSCRGRFVPQSISTFYCCAARRINLYCTSSIKDHHLIQYLLRYVLCVCVCVKMKEEKFKAMS